MWKKLRVALVGDGARQAGLAGAGRAVEQHALGRIDAEALEQFGVAQRQLDHLAQRVDGVLHPAEVVIGDVGAALARLPSTNSEQHFDLTVLSSMWTIPRGTVETTVEAHFLQREGGGIEQLPDMLGHVGVDPLMAGGGDDVALGERAAFEAALQRRSRALQADVVLCRCEDDAGGGLGHRLAGFRRNRPSRRRHWRAGARRGG